MLFNNIKNFKNGWIVGDFDPSLFKSTQVEIAHFHLPAGHKADGHYHKISTEYNYIIKGSAVIDGKTLVAGDIFVYEPLDQALVDYPEDTDIIVIKTPASKGDKYYGTVLDRRFHELWYDKVINKEPSPDYIGLKYIPRFVESGSDLPSDLNRHDFLNDVYNRESTHTFQGLIHEPLLIFPKDENFLFTPRCAKVLSNEIKRLGERCEFVLEIGREFEISGSTTTLKRSMPPGSLLVSLDNRGGSHPDDSVICVNMESTDSRNQELKKAMDKWKISKFDLIFIDGNHSLETVLEEWRIYVPMLSDGGTIAFHDTAFHPGPHLLMEAIDETVFDKCVYHEHDDFGIGVARKRKE